MITIAASADAGGGADRFPGLTCLARLADQAGPSRHNRTAGSFSTIGSPSAATASSTSHRAIDRPHGATRPAPTRR